MIQREIEANGIRTASIMHFPKIGQKVRAPRIMAIPFPLGHTFGKGGDKMTQESILKDLLRFSLEGKPESVVELGYKWK